MSNNSYALLKSYIDKQFNHCHRLFNLDAAIEEHPELNFNPLETEFLKEGFSLHQNTLTVDEISDDMMILISDLEEFQWDTLKIFLDGLFYGKGKECPHPNASTENELWTIGQERAEEYDDLSSYIQCDHKEALIRGFFAKKLEKRVTDNPYGGQHEHDIWVEGYELAGEIL